MFIKQLCVVFAFLKVVTFADPNADFGTCCTDKGVPESCLKYCTYDEPPSSAIKLFRHNPRLLDGVDDCTGEETLVTVVQCLQKGKDNRECCKAAEVGSEFNYCLDLCDGTRPLTLDGKYEYCQKEGIRASIKKCGKDS